MKKQKKKKVKGTIESRYNTNQNNIIDTFPQLNNINAVWQVIGNTDALNELAYRHEIRPDELMEELANLLKFKTVEDMVDQYKQDTGIEEMQYSFL